MIKITSPPSALEIDPWLEAPKAPPGAPTILQVRKSFASSGIWHRAGEHMVVIQFLDPYIHHSYASTCFFALLENGKIVRIDAYYWELEKV